MKIRYETFLLEDSEIPIPPDSNKEGLIVVANNISEVEQCENVGQNNLLTAIYSTLCELLEIKDVEMQTAGWFNSFLLVTKHETDFNCQKGFESPQLSRQKLKKANPKEVAEAMIDLFLNRSKWNIEKSYSKLFV